MGGEETTTDARWAGEVGKEKLVVFCKCCVLGVCYVRAIIVCMSVL